MRHDNFLLITHQKAPAKLNLFLHIVSKRADAYHNLETIMLRVDDIYDDILVYKAPYKMEAHTTTEMNQHSLDIQTNICDKVLTLFRNKFPNKVQDIDCLKIHIIKRIPIGAGMGGGSSNAATIILFLNDYLALNLSTQQLIDLAKQVGADVPFFIAARKPYQAAFVQGIGEIIELIEIPRIKLLIKNVEGGISTKDAYAAINGQFSQSMLNSCNKFQSLLDEKDFIEIIKNAHNDFEPYAMNTNDDINTTLNDLCKVEGVLFSRMTGTGSSCFAILGSDLSMTIAESNHHKASLSNAVLVET